MKGRKTMSFIQREIDRIRALIINGEERSEELYAAQQALEWVLEPSAIKSPFEMITGIREGLEDCPAPSNPALCGYTSASRAG
jgi:hypothetical protein